MSSDWPKWQITDYTVPFWSGWPTNCLIMANYNIIVTMYTFTVKACMHAAAYAIYIPPHSTPLQFIGYYMINVILFCLLFFSVCFCLFSFVVQYNNFFSCVSLSFALSLSLLHPSCIPPSCPLSYFCSCFLSNYTCVYLSAMM